MTNLWITHVWFLSKFKSYLRFHCQFLCPTKVTPLFRGIFKDNSRLGLSKLYLLQINITTRSNGFKPVSNPSFSGCLEITTQEALRLIKSDNIILSDNSFINCKFVSVFFNSKLEAKQIKLCLDVFRKDSCRRGNDFVTFCGW